MSARRHLKYYLKVYSIVIEHSNGFPHVLKDKRLTFGIRMGVFPEWKKFGRASGWRACRGPGGCAVLFGAPAMERGKSRSLIPQKNAHRVLRSGQAGIRHDNFGSGGKAQAIACASGWADRPFGPGEARGTQRTRFAQDGLKRLLAGCAGRPFAAQGELEAGAIENVEKKGAAEGRGAFAKPNLDRAWVTWPFSGISCRPSWLSLPCRSPSLGQSSGTRASEAKESQCCPLQLLYGCWRQVSRKFRGVGRKSR
jgi:hypothetical protein